MHHIYCPKTNCTKNGLNKSKIVKAGTYKRKNSEQSIQRYRCSNCNHRFSARYFSQNFRCHYDFINQKIFNWMINGASNSAIARNLGIAEGTVRCRIRRLSQHTLRWIRNKKEVKSIDEHLAYDGFESFYRSQYHPCHVNHLVGKDSHYIYNFNLATLNRKGRMTEYQKIKLKKLQEKEGRFPGNLIEKQTAEIVNWSLSKSPANLTIITDEHRAYIRAIRKNKERRRIYHIKINSKIKRDVHNKLFPVNALDMQLRHFLACFKRETIAFTKTLKAMAEKLTLFYLHKNFMRPIFYSKKKNRIESIVSPAMKIGLSKKILDFEDIFGSRIGMSKNNEKALWENQTLFFA